MYYRRKLELALIQAFGGELSKTDFQKLLFLLTQKQEKPDYDFVPYKYGCFSFQAATDLSTLVHKGNLLEVDAKWVLPKNANPFASLAEADKLQIRRLRSAFGQILGRSLIRHIYIHYPYYATRSNIAEEVLSKEEIAEVKKSLPVAKDYHIYTIGYEGISIEAYFNKLIKQDVKVLCDVRKNAVSMKYGFSKSQLMDFCQKLEIQYVHIPELGIESSKRKDLEGQQDYNQLFEEYDRETLPHRREYLQKIQEMIQLNKRVALTCFEALPQQCHRARVAKALKLMTHYELTHL